MMATHLDSHLLLQGQRRPRGASAKRSQAARWQGCDFRRDAGVTMMLCWGDRDGHVLKVSMLAAGAEEGEGAQCRCPPGTPRQSAARRSAGRAARRARSTPPRAEAPAPSAAWTVPRPSALFALLFYSGCFMVKGTYHASLAWPALGIMSGAASHAAPHGPRRGQVRSLICSPIRLLYGGGSFPASPAWPPLGVTSGAASHAASHVLR